VYAREEGVELPLECATLTKMVSQSRIEILEVGQVGFVVGFAGIAKAVGLVEAVELVQRTVFAWFVGLMGRYFVEVQYSRLDEREVRQFEAGAATECLLLICAAVELRGRLLVQCHPHGRHP
jgi:hypothetical protein